MFSIICVYNEDTKLNEFLLKSIREQDADYELILINNTNNSYPSAAAALNAGGKRVNGDYLIFAHQDIELDSPHWLRDAETIISHLPNFGIAGVAGKKSGAGVITNIKHGFPPHSAGKFQIKEPIEVQTLDECLIIIPQEVYNKLQFDERTCTDWHLYAVDYCLSTQKMGYRTLVLPLSCYHQSTGSSSGSLSKGYFSTLEKLQRKHHMNYKVIYTTMGNWHMAIPVGFQKTRVWRVIFLICEKILFIRGQRKGTIIEDMKE